MKPPGAPDDGTGGIPTGGGGIPAGVPIGGGGIDCGGG
jgi:hypothetical protein